MFKRLRNLILMGAVVVGITAAAANPAAAVEYDKAGHVYSTCVHGTKRFSVHTYFDRDGYVYKFNIKSSQPGYHTLNQWWNGPDPYPRNDGWRSVQGGHRRYMAAETWYWWYPAYQSNVVTGYHKYYGYWRYYGDSISIDFNSSSPQSAIIDCRAIANTSNYRFN